MTRLIHSLQTLTIPDLQFSEYDMFGMRAKRFVGKWTRQAEDIYKRERFIFGGLHYKKLWETSPLSTQNTRESSGDLVTMTTLSPLLSTCPLQ